MKRSIHSILLAGCFSTLIITPSFAESTDDDELLDLSLEELISLDVPDVTSVSRRKQRLMDSAAAVFVITNEDLQRSGVTSIPEALRMVPGMQVARMNGNTWSISTRGFNYIFANKLLVLIDGRTVYSPLFSGVNWDVQDTMLEDIDRIEVIRGPGAALWGANAVNGVINIITKHSGSSQGGLLSAGFGSEEKAFGAYRYGGQISDDAYYRAYYKGFERDGQKNTDGTDAADDWKMHRAGFRTDWIAGNKEFTVQGDVYDGTTRPPLRIIEPDTLQYKPRFDESRDQRGGNISAYFKNNLSDTNNYSFRTIYDNYQNFDYRITEKRNTFDLEYQHHLSGLGRHDIVWGASYRATLYKIGKTDYMYFKEGGNEVTNHLYSAFIQDYISLAPKWSLTLSSRFEHNDFSGFEIQPNMRLTWKQAENRTFWGAISRAVKTPSLSETKLQTQGVTFDDFPSTNGYVLLPISGNKDVKSEKLLAFELGYRETFSESLRLDATMFFNQYKDILTYTESLNCPIGAMCGEIYNRVLTIPTELSNGLDVKTYGFEAIVDWQAKSWWKLQFTYSWLNTEAVSNKEQTDFLQRNETSIEDLPTKNTANIRSSMNLPNRWYLDVWLRYMDNFKSAGIGAYSTMDLRLAKKFSDNLEVSLIGQNLFNASQPQFFDLLSGLGATEVERAWYLQLRWQH